MELDDARIIARSNGATSELRMLGMGESEFVYFLDEYAEVGHWIRWNSIYVPLRRAWDKGFADAWYRRDPLPKITDVATIARIIC